MYQNKVYALALAMALVSAAHAEDNAVSINANDDAAQNTPAISTLDVVTVTASPFDDQTELDLAQPVDVIGADELRRKRGTNIGDTLSGELGVSSSAFGPGAGRPIIRGLDGPRIRVLENGIGTQDVSTVSPDHQVTVESLNAEQVEILRGPATLLYGSGASGGAVNVVTNRIPQSIPADGFDATIELRANSASDERSGAANLTGGGGNFAWHFDGFKRKTDDYDIPGNAVRDDPDSASGELPNSDIDSEGVGAGVSYIGERGFLGISVSGLESNYGIPGEEQVRIDLEQTRYNLDSELDNPLPGFDRLKFRFGYNDYEHQELESTGEVGTTFTNKAIEGRIELVHAPIANWRGALGLQYMDRDFSAIGEEAFVPPTQSDAVGLFLVEERQWERWSVQLGARGEHATQRPSGDNPDRDFDVYSLSAGTIYQFNDAYSLGVALTRAERALSTEELYSNGPHLATTSFEIGDPTLDEEVSNNLDITLRKTTGRVTGKVNLFYNRIDDYVFEQDADDDGDGIADRVDEEGNFDPEGELRLLNFAGADAEFYGAETEAVFSVLQGRPDALDVRVFADYVRGKLRNGDDLPRITPLRFGISADYRRGAWRAGLGLTRVTEQDRTAALETTTDGYSMLDADLSYTLRVNKADHVLFLRATNLLDEEARVHTSFLKDVAPLPGLGILLGVRSSF